MILDDEKARHKITYHENLIHQENTGNIYNADLGETKQNEEMLARDETLILANCCLLYTSDAADE